MTQLGLHSHIRVTCTRGIMICVAKAKYPSNLAAHLHDRPVFLRRGLNVVDLGPELQCLVGPQNAPLHNMLLLVAYCVPCIHNMLRWSILCTLHTQYATRGAYCVGSVHMLFQWSSEGTQYALLENMSRGICLSF